MNLSPCSTGGSGPLTPETRAKISATLTGRPKPPVSEETRVRMASARRGASHSKETKAKIGEANRRRTWTEESRKKLSNEHKGKTLSPDQAEALAFTGESLSQRSTSSESVRRIGGERAGTVTSMLVMQSRSTELLPFSS